MSELELHALNPTQQILYDAINKEVQRHPVSSPEELRTSKLLGALVQSPSVGFIEFENCI